MKYILGIDAGATNTQVLIWNEAGKTIGSGSGGPANIHTNTKAEIKTNITEAINVAQKNSGIKISMFDAICFGGAGQDTEALKKKTKHILLEFLKIENSDKLLVVNDIQLVRPTCSDTDFGIAVITGTGSNFYGINKEGEEAYVGGLDYRLSDQGSAYWMGQRVLFQVVKSFDERGEPTILQDLVFKEFDIKGTRQLADIVYKKNFGKSEIAKLASLLYYGYKKADRASILILEEAVNETADCINTLIRRLNMENDTFDIVAVGGIYFSKFPFAERIYEKTINKKARFIVCDKPPAMGAVKLAYKLLKK